MSITISNAYVQSFERNVRLVAQQGEAKLRNFVHEVMDNSKAHNWDVLGSADARSKTAARMVSPAGGDGSGAVGGTAGLAWTRRKSTIATYDAGEVIEHEDIAQMLADPNAPVTMALGNAMKRKVDDVIITAATAAAKNGDDTTTAFTSAQTVGNGTTVIDLDDLLAIQEIFLGNDVDVDEEKCLVIGPTQYRSLMSIEKITSADYQSLKALASGYLPNFLGFHHVILSNRLANPATGQINCLAFTTKAIGLHVAADISARVAERSDMSFAWQLYCAMSIGAVRIEDKKVVKLHLKDATS